MSRPRRFYGPNPPGRLSATMLKVLAAEVTDGARLGRAKTYVDDGAVTDVTISPGCATVQVLGSQPEPYRVDVRAEPGDGVPTRSQIAIDCSCPDAQQGNVCKHGAAALLTIANEVGIEPALLATWRSSDQNLAPVIELFDPPAAHDTASSVDDDAAEINALLLPQATGALPHAAVPDLGEVIPIDHPPTRDPVIDRLLHETTAEMRLEWH